MHRKEEPKSFFYFSYCSKERLTEKAIPCCDQFACDHDEEGVADEEVDDDDDIEDDEDDEEQRDDQGAVDQKQSGAAEARWDL